MARNDSAILLQAVRQHAPWRGRRIVVDGALRIGTAAALAIDTYVHATDASFYSIGRGGTVSEATIFLLEAALASAAALVVLVGAAVRTGRRAGWAIAFLIAATALSAVVVSTYVDVGPIGPVPDPYEPTWATPGKQLSAYAEGTGTALAAAGFALARRAAQRSQSPGRHDGYS